MSEKQICDYHVYEWEETQFLEKAEIILSLSGVLGIHKILRKKSKPLYLVPEDFYLTAKSSINLKDD